MGIFDKLFGEKQDEAKKASEVKKMKVKSENDSDKNIIDKSNGGNKINQSEARRFAREQKGLICDICKEIVGDVENSDIYRKIAEKGIDKVKAGTDVVDMLAAKYFKSYNGKKLEYSKLSFEEKYIITEAIIKSVYMRAAIEEAEAKGKDINEAKKAYDKDFADKYENQVVMAIERFSRDTGALGDEGRTSIDELIAMVGRSSYDSRALRSPSIDELIAMVASLSLRKDYGMVSGVEKYYELRGMTRKMREEVYEANKILSIIPTMMKGSERMVIKLFNALGIDYEYR